MARLSHLKISPWKTLQQVLHQLVQQLWQIVIAPNKIWKRIRVGLLVGIFTIVTGQLVSAQLVNESDLGSLKKVPVPEPANLYQFVKSKPDAIALGKALFWDMQVGSDGRTSCASCHFHAGADNRSKNQISPGLLAGDSLSKFGFNHQLQAQDFPFHKLSNINDRNSTVLSDTNDVASSQGVFNAFLTNIVLRKAADASASTPDPTFQVNGVNVRRVEPRNTPTVINAVFNFRNFWDGRAQNEFNGQNPFGDRDPNARVARAGTASTVTLERIRLENASLASQAVGPPLSSIEMSAANRAFAQLGRKLLSVKPLAQQQVARDDSVLGSISHFPVPGLRRNYRTLIQNAFREEWWRDNNSIIQVDSNGNPSIRARPGQPSNSNEFTVMEYNFPLFFGLAVQLYEATLVSDNSPVDQFFDGNQNALTAQQKRGLDVFTNKGKCINCHGGAETTNASVRNVRNKKLERMIMGDNRVAVYDNGFYNIGVRPTREDVGVGGTDPFGKPLSDSKLTQQQIVTGRPAPIVPGDPEDNIPNAPLNPNERVAVNGAFKTSSLRNIELTAPYFHNGGQLTLKQVVDFYNRGGDFANNNHPDLDPDIQNLGLTEQEKNDLVAFLRGLTDERVRTRKAPFDHPQLFLTNGHSGNTTSVTNDGTGKALDTILNIPAVGRNGGAPLPTFLGVNAAAVPTVQLQPPSQPALQGSVTQQDCPSGSVLKLVSSGYACMPK
ncbi:MAG: cytochrome c peroxidase [Synechococcales bacterium]|nr:cytochrome c peroxidase [Synechococcales bacterium]